MAINKVAARFLIEARDSGVEFGRTLTLGRQSLLTSPLWLARELAARRYIDPATKRDWARRISRRPYVADELWRALGAHELEVLDNSDYEDATIICDLNDPVPESLHASFDVVFDGGSLEHVFEFPTALRSVMAMPKVGGHLLIGTPTNNMSGHGFYQFSPELFYRALGPDSGFEVERMIVVESDHLAGRLFGRVPYFAELVGPRYEVQAAPMLEQRRRVDFTSRNPAVLLVQARRVADRAPLEVRPQQGVWLAHWDAHAGSDGKEAEVPVETGHAQVSPAARRGPDPERLGIPPAITAGVFHAMFAGFGRALRPLRGALFRLSTRRRGLRHQPGSLRRLRD